MSQLPKGFRAAGLPRGDRPRPSRHGLSLFYSEKPAQAAACFTTNQVKCVHIPIDQDHLKDGKAQVIMINSGCANCCTGKRGVQEAKKTIEWASQSLNVPKDQILIASTGVIGDFMPMDLLSEEIPLLSKRLLSPNGLHIMSFQKAAQAILTTDTTLKIASAFFEVGGQTVRIWGCAKGAGMIHPKMTLSGELNGATRQGNARATRNGLKGKHATMLGFILTDAAIPAKDLRVMLQEATNGSFNQVTVDGDMSTNDTVIILANGASGVSLSKPKEREKFAQLLNNVCVELAQEIARDGEGASKFLEIRVQGARTEADAQRMAEVVATSPLVKTAAYGEDSNWGRILAALGRAGVPFDPSKVDISFDDLCVFRHGAPTAVTAEAAREPLKKREVTLNINVHQGKASGLYWTCDFTGQYVDINARYRT